MVLLTLRSIAVIVGAGVLLIIARPYLAGGGADSVPGKIYVVLGVAALLVIYLLSLRPIVAELRARRVPAPQVPVALRVAQGRERPVYKYPAHLLVLVVGFGLLWIAVPFLARASGASVTPGTYACTFAAAAVLFAVALRLSLFSVTVGPDGILIKAFTSRRVRFEEIKSVTMGRTRNGPQIAVSLIDGKTVYFSRLLRGFDELASILTSRTSSHSDGG